MSIKYFLQIIVALSLLIFIIISRFKQIALTKTFLTFHIIFILNITLLFCILLITTIYFLIKKQKAIHVINLKKDLQNLVHNLFYSPLQQCDDYLVNILTKKTKFNRANFINKKLYHIFTNVLQPNNFSIKNYYFILYFLFKYMPKILVVTIFLIDVFYYQQFYYFYWSLPLLLIPLFVQYLKYVVFLDYKKILAKFEQNIEFLDIIPSTSENIIPRISVNDYLTKTVYFFLEKKINPYRDRIGFTYHYYQELYKNANLEKNYVLKIDYEADKKRYQSYIVWIEKVNFIYVLLTTKERLIDLYINLIVFGSYLIGWLYILIIVINDITFLQNFKDTIEPFSDTFAIMLFTTNPIAINTFLKSSTSLPRKATFYNDTQNTQLAFKIFLILGKKVIHHNQTCDQPKCETMDCPTVCGNPVNRKAIGQSLINDTTKTTVIVSSIDLDNNQKSQRMVMYKQAHKVNSTPEHVNGTVKIQTESSMRNIIIQHEDKT